MIHRLRWVYFVLKFPFYFSFEELFPYYTVRVIGRGYLEKF